MPTDTDTVDPDLTPAPDLDTGAVAETTDDAPDTPSAEGPVVLDGLCTGSTVPPKLLEIDENVRKTFDLDDHPEVTASIREHGVRNPILVIRMPDGRLVVRDGQVRTLTALAYEQSEVPVYIRDFDPNTDTREAEIDRIGEQIDLNDRRIPLTNGDRAAGIAQMLDLGASLTRVAKAVQIKRDEVKLAGKVGASATARRLIDDGQYDMTNAAVIADYENLGDHDAVRRLLNVHADSFDHEVNRIAADRAEQRTTLANGLTYAQAGIGLLTDYPDLDGTSVELLRATELVDTDANPVDTAHILANPTGWLVWIEIDSEQMWVEIATGDPVDPDTVDWDTRYSPDAEPAEGLCHAREVEQRDRLLPEFFLPRDLLAAAGVRERPEPTTTIDEIGDDTDSDPGYDANSHTDSDIDHHTDTDDADREAEAERVAAERRAAEQAAAQAAENDRIARRRVRELNKLGIAAKATRTEFVTRLLTRRTPPAQAAVFLTRSMLADPGLINEYHAFDSALKLLGIEGFQSRHAVLDTLDTVKPARAQVIALALVLGGYEHRADKDLWRYSDKGTRRYLTFLRELGYTLAPVELAGLGEIDAEAIDIDHPTPSDTDDNTADTTDGVDGVETGEQDLPAAA